MDFLNNNLLENYQHKEVQNKLLILSFYLMIELTDHCQ